jgi:WD40 repeat protein
MTGTSAALVDPKTHKRTKVAPDRVNPAEVYGVMPSADGIAFLVTLKPGRDSDKRLPIPVSLFDAETGKELATGKGDGNPLAHPQRAALAPDGSHVAYTHLDDNRIVLLDLKTGKSADVTTPGSGRFEFPQFSGDGKRLATITSGGKVAVWTAGRWDVARTIGNADEYVEEFAMSQDGKLIAGVVERVRARDWALRVWNLETREELWSVAAPQGPYPRKPPLTAVAFGKKGEALAVGTQTEVVLYHAGSGGRVGTVGAAAVRDLENSSGLMVRITHLSLSPDGKLLAVTHQGGADVVTKLYDISELKEK